MTNTEISEILHIPEDVLDRFANAIKVATPEEKLAMVKVDSDTFMPIVYFEGYKFTYEVMDVMAEYK